MQSIALSILEWTLWFIEYFLDLILIKPTKSECQMTNKGKNELPSNKHSNDLFSGLDLQLKCKTFPKTSFLKGHQNFTIKFSIVKWLYNRYLLYESDKIKHLSYYLSNSCYHRYMVLYIKSMLYNIFYIPEVILHYIDEYENNHGATYRSKFCRYLKIISLILTKLYLYVFV